MHIEKRVRSGYNFFMLFHVGCITEPFHIGRSGDKVSHLNSILHGNLVTW